MIKVYLEVLGVKSDIISRRIFIAKKPQNFWENISNACIYRINLSIKAMKNPEMVQNHQNSQVSRVSTMDDILSF